ncbi:MAG: autotransporter assembly complex family protein [Pseudomonadota bacterium]
MFSATQVCRPARCGRRTRILAYFGLTVCTALGAPMAPAQALHYAVQIEAPAPLRALLEANLDLLRWRGNPRLDRDQLARLVKGAPEQARTLVATEGYYSPSVSASAELAGPQPLVRLTLEPGAPVLVGDVELVLTGFAAPFDTALLRNSWSLPVGRRFRQADWELAKRQLLRQALASRYPRARLRASSATVDPEVRRALLRVELDSGPEVHFGALRIEGLQRYPASLVTNLNQIAPGTPYSEAALLALQTRLQDLGYFSGVDVSVDLGAALDEDLEALAAPERARATGVDTVPVVVRVTENRRKNVAAGVGYSTNTGNRAQLSYDDLSVFGLRMKSNITLETRRQNARADFYFPTTAQGDSDSVGAGFERTDINGEVLGVATLSARRAWGTPLLERSLGLEFLTEQRSVDGQPSVSSKSVPLSYSITRRALDNLLQPSRGYVLNGQIGGALLPLLTDQRFIRASTRFVRYQPLGAAATLVLRGEAGALASKEKAGVPGSYLFRAGGDQSVRGYGYQQLGVHEGTAIVGGRYLLTGSAELQYWFKPPYGVALFYDAGNAADTLRALAPKSGYGIGARWRSPVGPINVDLAYGHALHKLRLHFSLGFSF